MKDSFDVKTSSLKRLNSKHAFWALVAFIAAQKFALPNMSGFICLIPFLVALANFGQNSKLRNTFLLLALFWSTDNAVLGYGATPSVIRYLIYITVILTLALNSAITKAGLLGTALVYLLYLGITLVNANDNLSGTQAWRDLTIMLLGGILFSLRRRRAYELDIELLFYATTGYLISECVNYFIFRGAWYGEYMSYDTTKYLIVSPSLIALILGRPLVAWTLVYLTIIVLVGYVSRTLFLMYLISLVVIFLTLPIRHGLRKRSFVIAGAGLIILVADRLELQTMFESSKAIYMFVFIKMNGLQSLQLLDPVRFASSAIFFALPLHELMFGRGLGSGLYDVNHLLSFVTDQQTAFTVKELQSRYFFNFHDIWVDVGVRFGLFPLTLFFIWFLRLRPIANRSGAAIWLLTLIGIFAAFYGASGLISIAVLLRVLQSHRSDHV